MNFLYEYILHSIRICTQNIITRTYTLVGGKHSHCVLCVNIQGTLNSHGSLYPIWVIPLGFALTAMSIAFIPFMFFFYCNCNYPFVGRAPRARLPAPAPNDVSPDASEPNAIQSSQRPLINRTESSTSDGFVQSDSSFGVGDSILRLPSQSDRSSSRERKSVTIKVNAVEYKKTSDEVEAEPMTVSITPPPEFERRRTHSGSTSDREAK